MWGEGERSLGRSQLEQVCVKDFDACYLENQEECKLEEELNVEFDLGNHGSIDVPCSNNLAVPSESWQQHLVSFHCFSSHVSFCSA